MTRELLKSLQLMVLRREAKELKGQSRLLLMLRQRKALRVLIRARPRKVPMKELRMRVPQWQQLNSQPPRAPQRNLQESRPLKVPPKGAPLRDQRKEAMKGPLMAPTKVPLKGPPMQDPKRERMRELPRSQPPKALMRDRLRKHLKAETKCLTWHSRLRLLSKI